MLLFRRAKLQVVTDTYISNKNSCPVTCQTGRHATDRGIAQPIIEPRARKQWDRHLHAPAALPQGKAPRTHCTVGQIGLEICLHGSGKAHPKAVRTPDRPARSYSLYRPQYSNNNFTKITLNSNKTNIYLNQKSTQQQRKIFFFLAAKKRPNLRLREKLRRERLHLEKENNRSLEKYT